jgi:hypothetical protein
MELEVIEQHIRKTTIIANVISITGALVVAMSVGYGFYYNTKSALTQHGEELLELKDDVGNIHKQIDNIEIYKGVSSSEMDNLTLRVERMDNRLEKVDDKLDKILMQTR